MLSLLKIGPQKIMVTPPCPFPNPNISSRALGSYFMGISVAYHLCVAPDHDTFESSIVNSIETKRDGERRRAEAERASSSPTSGNGGVQGAVALAPGEHSGGGGGRVGGVSREVDGVSRRAPSCGSGGSATGDQFVVAAEQAQGGAENVAAERQEEEERQGEYDDWGEVQVRRFAAKKSGRCVLCGCSLVPRVCLWCCREKWRVCPGCGCSPVLPRGCFEGERRRDGVGCLN